MLQQLLIVTPWARPSDTGMGLIQDFVGRDGKPINDFSHDPDVGGSFEFAYKMNRGSEDALCFDIRTNIDITFRKGDFAKVPTGVYIAMPPHMGCLMRERSGLADKGFRLSGGTLDADYRGEYKVMLTYDPPTRDVLDPGKVYPDYVNFFRGDRIAQMYFTPEDPSNLRWQILGSVTMLPKSLRGSGGFGSSGIG